MRGDLPAIERYGEVIRGLTVLPEPLTYRCAYCDFQTGSLAELQRHIRQVNGHFEVDHTCRICGRRKDSEEALERHVRRCHHMERRRKKGKDESKRNRSRRQKPNSAHSHQPELSERTIRPPTVGGSSNHTQPESIECNMDTST